MAIMAIMAIYIYLKQIKMENINGLILIKIQDVKTRLPIKIYKCWLKNITVNISLKKLI